MYNTTTLSDNTDCLSASIHQGIYWIRPDANLGNYPFPGSWGWMFAFSSVRIAYKYSDGLMYGNFYANGAWCGWTQLNYNNHTHDERYYTENEINTKLQNKLGFTYCRSYVKTFSSGKCTIPFSELGLKSRPQIVFLTTCNPTTTLMSYNFDESTSQLVLNAIDTIQHTGINGSVRFTMLVSN